MGPEPEKCETNLSGMELIPKDGPKAMITRELKLEAALVEIIKIPSKDSLAGAWDELDEARRIASKALGVPNERK